jgi:hypothetical protein
MVEADRFKTAAICIIVLLFESINEICSRSSGCNLPLYFMAQFSVYSRYTKFCVSTLKSRGDKNFKHGINLSYSYFPGLSENENFSNKLNLHFVNLGYVVHYQNAEKWKGLYSDLIVSAASSVIFRKLNGEPFVYDETQSKAFGIGGDIKFKLGYEITSNSRNLASPFIAVGCSPYFYSPNTEAVINQTKGLVVNNGSGLFTTQIGIAFHLVR